MKPKRSIVVGYTGQDGTLLVEALRKRGDEVIGIGRQSCTFPKRFSEILIKDITNDREVNELVELFQPNEIYYLPAFHVSSEGRANLTSPFVQFMSSQEVHVTGLICFLAAIVEKSPDSRLFYASSSLVFSGENGEVQDEKTFYTPQGFYGITKAQGMWLCKEFRDKYGAFVSTGILYNHESHLRPSNFITTKIIQAAIRISQGKNERIEVGNLSALVDWGYAADYVNAFQAILAQNQPDDFIVATGEAHTVKEFIEIVFNYFNLNFEKYVVENKNILTRAPFIKIGDVSKLKLLTGWRPSFSFEDFVVQLIEDHRR